MLLTHGASARRRCLGELHHVLRVPSMLTCDLAFLVGAQVVHRGQVVEMVDLPLSALMSSAATPSFLLVRSPNTGTARAALTPQYS
jgi:hypothetical protein